VRRWRTSGCAAARSAAVALACAATGSLAAGASAADPDVARTWERAELWVNQPPFGFANGRLADAEMEALLLRLPAGTRLPTVLLMHDCSHFKGSAWTFARNLANAGYAVLIPDSFAREDRPATCDRWRRPLPGTPAEAVFAMRMAELAHAARQARGLPWVDAGRLVLMGVGEGADAVARFEGAGFLARVLADGRCGRGYAAPAAEPVLVLAARDNPNFAGIPPDACVAAATARGGAATTHVFPAALYDLSGLRAAREALLAWLNALRGG